MGGISFEFASLIFGGYDIQQRYRKMKTTGEIVSEKPIFLFKNFAKTHV